MDFTQQPLLSVLVTLGLVVAYLAGKIIEHVSSRPRDKVVYEDGAPVVKSVTPDGIDLGMYTLMTGLGSIFSYGPDWCSGLVTRRRRVYPGERGFSCWGTPLLFTRAFCKYRQR